MCGYSSIITQLHENWTHYSFERVAVADTSDKSVLERKNGHEVFGEKRYGNRLAYHYYRLSSTHLIIFFAIIINKIITEDSTLPYHHHQNGSSSPKLNSTQGTFHYKKWDVCFQKCWCDGITQVNQKEQGLLNSTEKVYIKKTCLNVARWRRWTLWQEPKKIKA